jgi:hypothetical protein
MMNNKRLSDIGTELGKLCEEKNVAYGDSFAKSGRVLEMLYPDGVKPHQYTDMLGIIRVLDKLFRIATKKNAFGESPWRDIGGYGILGTFNDEQDYTLTDKDFTQEGFPIAFQSRHPKLLTHDTICLPHDKQEVPPDARINAELRELADEALRNEVELVKSCGDCYYELVSMDDMPCKKCNDKPFKPHFTRTKALKHPA